MNRNDTAPFSLINSAVKSDKSGQAEAGRDPVELKDFQRKETVYETIHHKSSAASRDKAIKIMGVILAALILILLVLVNNTSSHGPGLDPGQLLQVGVILSIAILLIRKIVRKQG